MLFILARIRTASLGSEASLKQNFHSFCTIYTNDDTQQSLDVLSNLERVQKLIPKKHFIITHANCTKQLSFCKNIRTFPTIVFKNVLTEDKQDEIYKGDFSFDDLFKTIENRVNIPLGHFTDYRGFTDEINSNKTEVRSFFISTKHNFPMYDISIDFMPQVTPCIIQNYNGIIEKQINNTEFTDLIAKNGKETFILFKDSEFFKYEGEFKYEQVKAWLDDILS